MSRFARAESVLLPGRSALGGREGRCGSFAPAAHPGTMALLAHDPIHTTRGGRGAGLDGARCSVRAAVNRKRWALVAEPSLLLRPMVDVGTGRRAHRLDRQAFAAVRQATATADSPAPHLERAGTSGLHLLAGHGDGARGRRIVAGRL